MKTVIVVSLACAVVGCERAGDKPRDPQEKANVASAPADNTRKNARDREPGALTPMDQGESEGDRALTQRLRQEVVKDGSLSLAAKNIKIITRDGIITLRGPVKSEQERNELGALARRLDGMKRVDNQLEIAPN
jgi:osmotically-inducible protein OsmY